MGATDCVCPHFWRMAPAPSEAILIVSCRIAVCCVSSRVCVFVRILCSSHSLAFFRIASQVEQPACRSVRGLLRAFFFSLLFRFFFFFVSSFCPPSLLPLSYYLLTSIRPLPLPPPP